MLIGALMSSMSLAAELKLFDVELRNASRSEITSAIAKAGGKKISIAGGFERYDASKISLPGAENLEAVYLDDKLVLVQYKFDHLDLKTDERLRKMIVLKYGQPRGSSNFDDEYTRDGKSRWVFDGGMELIYTREFFGTIYLTYVNKAEQARLEARVKAADQTKSQQEVKKNTSVF